MAFLASLAAPLLGGVIGAITGNATNKANAQSATNAQNQATNTNAAATQLAQQQQQQALANMFLRYQQYMQQNPQLAQTWKGITQPAQGAQQFGGGTVGAMGYSGPQNSGQTGGNNGFTGLAGSAPNTGTPQQLQFASLQPQQLAQAMQNPFIPQGYTSAASTFPMPGRQIQAVRGPVQ